MRGSTPRRRNEQRVVIQLIITKESRREGMKKKRNTKKYEYAAHYYRNGCMVGKSMERWETLDEAKWANLYCRGGETIVFARREVGEWEEVD